ncbi:MAG: hypothetical protein LBT94_09610 [Prevotellaceae bacterium]|jgi:hypothetical protein|nr:hypothetical protein [Prevotellaceae bacterium]
MSEVTTNSGEQGSQQNGQTIIVNQVEQASNGVGTAGFVLALLAVFLGWIPVFGWILWVLGLVLSSVGLFKSPKGLAITGFILSVVDLILLLTVFGTIAAMFGLGL